MGLLLIQNMNSLEMLQIQSFQTLNAPVFRLFAF